MDKVTKKIKSIAKKINLPESIVKEVYESQFKFIRHINKDIDFSKMTEEEFNNTAHTFNLKYLGKVYPDWRIIKKINNKRNK